jgi:polyferredoxin
VLTATDLVLAVVAAGMAATTAVFVRWAAEARSPLRGSVVVFVLLMMGGMLAGALVYFLDPSPARAVTGLWTATVIMSASVAVVFVGFLQEAARTPSSEPHGAWAGPRFVAAVVGLVLLNEFLMGWTFALAAGDGAVAAGSGPGAVLRLAGSVLVAPWFVFTMAAEMALTAAFLRRLLPVPALVLLGAQAGIMALSPPTLSGAAWTTAAIGISSAAMIGVVIYAMEHLYRQRHLAPAFASYLLRLTGVYAVMMAGISVWQLYGTPLVFGISVALEMIVFFEAVLRPEALRAAPTFTWLERPAWTTGLLGFVFVAELFMGASLAALLNPGSYVGSLVLLPLSGGTAHALGDALANGFYFFANTTATTAFLAMMGAEMGALAYFRLRETKGAELRGRLALMLGCYAAFVVFYPSLYYGEIFHGAPGASAPTSVPVLGWSMGLGSAPVAVGAFGLIVATYAILGAVTVLFGRRAVCSVFCSAAVMYQGTTIDAMKQFQRTSPLAHRYLGSRFSQAYSATTAGVMVALGGTAIASYLDSTGRANLTVGGADPSVFLFVLSFSVLWYVLFVTLPYAGTYSCVTMGWCYTGQISAWFSRIGFFRLKVRDREVCRRCTTIDCARACPVGLVDMPGHFRTKGEFRSAKCCGVGGCASACPYGNLYLADVRHWLRRRPTARPLLVAGALLPMAGAAPANGGPFVVTTPPGGAGQRTATLAP